MNKSKLLEDRHPDSVVLVLRGGFYHAIGHSAEVLACLTGYKLREMKGGEVECGFPYGSLNKIMKLLKENGINYQVYQNDEVTHQNSDGMVILNEFLKDANIPPPIQKKDGKEKKEEYEESSDLNLVPVTFRCPKEIFVKLELLSEKEWKSSFDAIIARVLEKGLSDG